MNEQKSYEESIGRLQEIVGELEQKDITLEQSMKLFEEGVLLVKQCGDVLSAAQQKVDMLSQTIDKIQEELE
jgi:exodeoxyribonuclease VII small subunit